ncbi:hypothetical protein SNEBB_009010 [Seison nebaliae]|nr:hypothetical protein SNEBB_009010 [Seison nebaliae]
MKIIIVSLTLISMSYAYSHSRMMNNVPIMNSKCINVQPVRLLEGYDGNQTPFINDFQKKSNICAGKQINERFAHPTNEGMYIECGFDGEKFERICPPKTKYVVEYGQFCIKDPIARCECKEGYNGQYCEMKIDYCRKNPCKNGGICTSYSTGYTSASVLSCPPGLTFDKEIRTCLSNQYQQAITNVLEQQKYQATFPKSWKPSSDPLQQSQQIFIQPSMPIKQIQPSIPPQQSWSLKKMMNFQNPIILQQPYQQKQQLPTIQQSSWSSSYQSPKFLEQKSQLLNNTPVKLNNGGY